VIVPAHLQDLKEGDLPEEQRVVVLDQIAIFRENAARREREKKHMEDEKEKYQVQDQRAPSRRESQRQWGAAHSSQDPQGYQHPVAFVRPQIAEAKGEGARTDEEEEEVRVQRGHRERDAALRDVRP
jgi:RNA-binding protein 25